MKGKANSLKGDRLKSNRYGFSAQRPEDELPVGRSGLYHLRSRPDESFMPEIFLNQPPPVHPQKTIDSDVPPGQQPGTPFSMAAVNAPEAGRSPASTFDPVKFAQIAGMAGAALAPREKYGSWQRDLGLAAAGLAGQELKERKEAPDIALSRRLKEAQIKKAERPEKPGHITDLQINPKTGTWEYGGRNVATGEFTSYREATDAEIESKVEGKPIDPDKIDIHGDIEYPRSSRSGTLRDAYQGAASAQPSIPQPSRLLLKDAQAGYGAGLEEAIVGARGMPREDIPEKAPGEPSIVETDIAETDISVEETGIDYTPESLKKSKSPGSQKTGKGDIPPKPPDSILSAEGQRDFKDRQTYSTSVIAGMGFDPFALDPDKEIERAQENLPEVFKKAFGGKILYRDIDTLDKNEKKHWNTVHRAYNVHAENVAKDQIARGKEQYKMQMKVFEDKLAEKKAMPAAMEKSLGSIFISVDDSGKKVGKIPAGILSKANKDAEQLINTGTMSGPEAIAKITDDLVRERLRISVIDDALSTIPEMKKGWLSDDAKNIENVKSIIKDALEQGADRKEIKARLREQGWDSKNIAKVLPKETDKIETPDKTVDAQQYKTPEDIRSAFKSGAITRDQAKQYLRQTMS